MKTVYFEKSCGCDWEDHYFPVVSDSKIDYSGTYVLASEAETEIAELKDEIKDLNTELTLAIARNQLNPLPGDNMIHDEAEIRRLYAIAKDASERERVLVEALETTILLRRTQIAMTCPGDHDEPCSHGEEFDSIIQHINAAFAQKGGGDG